MLVGVGALALAAGLAVASNPTPQARFSVPRGSSEIVVALGHGPGGGGPGSTEMFTLYGDGRLERTLTGRREAEPMYKAEARLTSDEMLHLLQPFGDRGFFDTTQESYEEDLRRLAPGGGTPGEDAATTTLIIRLEDYVAPNARSLPRDRTVRVSIADFSRARREFGLVPAVAAAGELQDRLQALVAERGTVTKAWP